MNHASLFSGIGGFDLAAEWMGWNNVFNCEWEEFPRQVLKHHFPNAIQHGDIKELDATTYAGRIDLLTGGFPCQPYSLAGKRKGKDDERHLWGEMLRVVRECTPRWVVGENVFGIVGWNGGVVFEEVCSDLEAQGYSVQPFILPAAGVGAPHRRDRVWFVAHAHDDGTKRTSGRDASKSGSKRLQERDKVQQPDKSDIVRKFSSDPDGFRLQHTQESGSVGQSKGEARGRATKSAQTDGGIRNASDTDSGRLEGSEKVRRDSLDVERESVAWDASDTDEFLSERGYGSRENGRSEQTKRTQSLDEPRGWEAFPTFPPVCGGDDGLPRVLDGITFPKWRRESIKAYGNAIVPQVALKIFKAIQEYENGTKL